MKSSEPPRVAKKKCLDRRTNTYTDNEEILLGF